MAIALAYHGLLRVPSRAETSDMTPCTLFVRFYIESMLTVDPKYHYPLSVRQR
jgi:hypothetical protein